MKRLLHIGIWGFGRVGKAAALFFARQGHTITVMDKRTLTKEEQKLLSKNNLSWVNQENPTTFFETHDIILPSPGIDRAPWHEYRHKMVTELDLFSDTFNGSLIAITGTVGKTTITTLLSQLLTAARRAPLTGGNIGIPTFTLLAERPEASLALLEVSSFQLENIQRFAPDLAIWTNFFSNHLDRHTTLDDYFRAKKQLLVNQRKGQQALLNAELVESYPELLDVPATVNLFTTKNTSALTQLPAQSSLFYLENRIIYVQRNDITKKLFSLDDTTVNTFPENLLVIGAALYLLGLDPEETFKQHNQELNIPEHRLEPCATLGTNIFYNDSKATTPQATLAAVKQLAPHPIKLFLGGLSKGIDRQPLIKALTQTTVAHIYCFGKEAEALHAMCTDTGIASNSHATLESALATCVKDLQTGDHVLFSPSGSSFDLFKDFEDRGRTFKQLVREIIAKQ